MMQGSTSLGTQSDIQKRGRAFSVWVPGTTSINALLDVEDLFTRACVQTG